MSIVDEVQHSIYDARYNHYKEFNKQPRIEVFVDTPTWCEIKRLPVYECEVVNQPYVLLQGTRVYHTPGYLGIYKVTVT